MAKAGMGSPAGGKPAGRKATGRRKARVSGGRRVDAKRPAKKPRGRSAPPTMKGGPMRRMKLALGCAFLLGLMGGALRADFPWHGNGTIENAFFMLECGVALVLIAACLWVVFGFLGFLWTVSRSVRLP